MRTFRDDVGVEWTVWAVDPARGAWDGPNRRSGRDRRLPPVADAGAAGAGAPERRRGPDRREQTLRAVRTLGATWAGGWLAFRSGSERRRLSPVPAGWEQRGDAELAALCRHAEAAPTGSVPRPPLEDDRRFA